MRLGELIIFEIIISPNRVRYFLYTTALCMYSIYLSTSDLLSFVISNTDKLNLAVYGNGLGVVMTS